MLTNHALTSMRTFLKNNIAYAKYKAAPTTRPRSRVRIFWRMAAWP